MNNLESGFHPHLTVLEPEISSARWVERALAPDFATVGALVPDGFSSYVRLFHPAKTTDGQPVRWAEVARWSGRKVHALMSFEGISSVADGYVNNPAPWVEDPLHGSLDKQDALELATFLGQFTRTPERCFFAVWDGYGQFHPGAMAKLTTAGGEPQFPPNAIKDAQRIKGVGRDYLLYSGPLSSISSFLWVSGITHRTFGGRPIKSGASTQTSIWTQPILEGRTLAWGLYGITRSSKYCQ